MESHFGLVVERKSKSLRSLLHGEISADLPVKTMTPTHSDPFYPHSPDLDNSLVQQTDADVFEAVKGGDAIALGILYDRYGLFVYRLARRMLENSQEAEDLTQEIFLGLQIRPNYCSQRGSFYTYIMTLTRSRAIDRLRARRSRWKLFQNWGKTHCSASGERSRNPLEQVSADERMCQVREALQQLPTAQRQVLELSYYEGLSQAEIAEKLNLPLGTVKTWCRRGLLKLRHGLQHLVEEQ
ncbi:MAG: sigma-70 family RNA polymerase sigma factor [Cyanobacteriota bacterium]|nr:sigma-70 family RNA polymerase sigma factor [Cyanobacteriota bacterium]